MDRLFKLNHFQPTVQKPLKPLQKPLEKPLQKPEQEKKPEQEQKPKSRQIPSLINKGFNMSMINRVHNVKPGCSACGKKVA